ncbi:MAG: histidyl-tRNA synthetase [Armatimonadetes bacterium OLB18]|nr:MAG: histidyl-tRNA synthetase [Armatimonadetes bacterium OLB18]
MRFQSPRGTEDVFPPASDRWLWLEGEFREQCRLFGYGDIRTPTFEDTELFLRSSGETSEVVSKQMYSFLDKGGRDITLKPEGTAPVVRAVMEHGLYAPGNVLRLSYVTPIFRYERPQKGRLREAHQVGIELIGSSSPEADFEVILFTVGFYERLGLSDVVVSLNSIGRVQCREAYRGAILDHAKGYLGSLDAESRAKVERNPLRLLDSKDPKAAEVIAGLPSILDFLEPESAAHFARLQSLLDFERVKYRVEPRIVRGLDYYTDTVFEVVFGAPWRAEFAVRRGSVRPIDEGAWGTRSSERRGSQWGVERALIVLESMGASPPVGTPSAFVVCAEDSLREEAWRLCGELRAASIACQLDVEARSLRSQLNQANKVGARVVAILGPEESAEGSVTLKQMESGEQKRVSRGCFVEEVANWLWL